MVQITFLKLIKTANNIFIFPEIEDFNGKGRQCDQVNIPRSSICSIMFSCVFPVKKSRISGSYLMRLSVVVHPL